ncbi:sirohydrochlorin chelatase [Cohnella faecalis]|uniref:sirohydrochlorin chelatase n=1 Tax=Cohnella faecalis TaxID=2315694 RepID=UPI001F35FF33|nr:CbiX/SirB N-terminal domain-containing protein [Cohnella faecalis]
MQPGILVISHGSREPGWVELVDETMGSVREALGSDVPTEAAFLELVDGRLIQDGIDRLEAAGASSILAIPLFVSSGSTHVDEIGWALGAHAHCRTETDLEPFRLKASLAYGSPMDEAEQLVDVLLERALALSAGEAGCESLLLIAHGSDAAGFREAWERGMNGVAAEVCRRGGFADAETAMLRLDEVPERWGS